MHRLIAGGTGLIGQALIQHWLKHNIQITVLGRDKQKISQCFGTAVKALSWDEFTNIEPSELKQFDAIINLCGANIGEARWTAARKQAIIESRVKTTKAIVEKLLPLGDQSPRLYNTSAIGIYGLQKTEGNHLPTALDEDSNINYDCPKDFLAEVGSLWEKTTDKAKAHGIHVVTPRFGVVLTPKGGAFEKLVLPFKLGVGGKIGSGEQAFSWIHIKDLIRIFDFLYQHPEIHGPINCVAPHAVMQKELAKTIAKTLHRPGLFPLPSFMVKLMFGEMGKCLLLQGQNIYPKKLVAHDFSFEFPNIEDAVKDLLNR